MARSSWLRAGFARKAASSASPARRLVLETLEDRWLLTLLTSTSLSDSALGVSTYGQEVTFTASVLSLGTPVNAGTVGFYERGALLAAVPVVSGQASFSTTQLSAGSHSIIAVYTDSLPYFTTSSGSDNLTVNPAPLLLTPVSQSIFYGQTVPTFTLFQSNGFVNGDTAASLTTQPTFTTDAASYGNAVGTYPIAGSGASDPNYTIRYGNGTLTITPDSTTTSIGASTISGASASAFSSGQAVQIVGTVTPLYSRANTLSGSIEFFDGSTLLATQPLSAGGMAGEAEFITSALSPGVHTLTAVYTGDANHTGSSSTANPNPTASSITVTVAASFEISGTLFHDYNGNGVQDPGEPGLAGRTLFLDRNGSGAFQTDDPTAVTDANGNYQFTGLSDGTYTVGPILLGGELLSVLPTKSTPITLSGSSGQTSVNVSEGIVLTSIAVPLTLPPKTAFPVQGNANANYVEALYRSILGRNADPGGLANWTNRLADGSLSRLQVTQAIQNSPEHFTQEVTAFYQTLLGRAPDAAGLQNWLQQLEGGMREEQVAYYFLSSPEYLSQGDKHFVDALYSSLLGRVFDSAGEATWLNALGDDASGNSTHPASLTHQQVIADFLYSQESLARLTEGYYEVYLQRPADPAGLNNWVGQLQQGRSFSTIGQQFLSSDEFYSQAAAQA